MNSTTKKLTIERFWELYMQSVAAAGFTPVTKDWRATSPPARKSVRALVKMINQEFKDLKRAGI